MSKKEEFEITTLPKLKEMFMLKFGENHVEIDTEDKYGMLTYEYRTDTIEFQLQATRVNNGLQWISDHLINE